MKRSLPNYEDLEAGEEGEIIEEITNVTASIKEEHDKFDDYKEDIDTTLFQKVALPVGKFDENFKEGDTPQSGDQYLCLVRHQRLGLPNILMDGSNNIESDSNSNRSKGKSVSEILKEFNDVNEMVIKVDKKWADDFYRLFEEGRRKLYEQIDREYRSEESDKEDDGNDSEELNPSLNLGINDKAAWLHHLYGHVIIKQNNEEQEKEEITINDTNTDTAVTFVPISPTIKVLAQLRSNQELVLKLLNYHRSWLTDTLKECFLSHETGRNIILTWLHALLMCLDEKLTSNDISGLRLLVRTLSQNFRSTVLYQKDVDEIILIISKSWHQSDLIKF